MGYVPQIDMIMERGILYTSFSLFIGVLFFNLIMYKGMQPRFDQGVRT